MSKSKRFEDALRFSARLHAKQSRKGSGTPYISHLLAVSAIALEHGATENEAIAALLHDAVEDQGGQATLMEIRERFGPKVARIVMGCSDTDETPKPPWRERKEAYIEHLRAAPYSVRLVAAADKLHNAGDVLANYRILGEDFWLSFKGGREGTLWYYREVVGSLSSAAQPEEERLSSIIEQLDEIVSALERLAKERAITEQPVTPTDRTGT